jgi:hypothetical protein
MKKDSIGIKNWKGDWEGRRLTIGMDPGDRTSRSNIRSHYSVGNAGR